MAKLNETTGNAEVNFSAKLTSIAAKPLTNVNGKNFYPASIEFTGKDGKKKQSSAIVYEGNLVDKESGEIRMEAGNHYMATASKTEQGVLIKVSHLAGNAPRPTEDMFDFSTQEESVEQEIGKSLQ